MLCPRCNSENDTGEKFCRHCGAPLVDTELFKSEEEIKKEEELKRKRQKNQNKEKQVQQNNTNRPKRTYSLIEKVYSRNYSKRILSLVKSVFILLIIIIAIYFISKYLLASVFQKANDYSVSGNKIPSVNYVLGDRKLKTVNYSIENMIFKTTYIYENVEKPRLDVINYVSYLKEKKNYEVIDGFDMTGESGKVIMITKSTTVLDDKIVVEINWTKNSINITTYHNKNVNKEVQ